MILESSLAALGDGELRKIGARVMGASDILYAWVNQGKQLDDPELQEKFNEYMADSQGK